MTNWLIENIYPTPIYFAEVDNFNSIQNEISHSIEKTEFSYHKVFGNSHKLSHHFISPSQEDYLMGDLPVFTNELKTHILRYCQQLNFGGKEYQFIGSWITLFERGDYAHIHNHGKVDFAGVYYFHKELNTKDFFFESPVEGAKLSAPYYSGKIYPPTNTGSLILFPGWLNHGVDRIETDGKRYSISFNIIFKKFVDFFPVNVCNPRTPKYS